MTREEAIDLLDNLIGFVEDNHGSDYDEALKIAIKALKQEPCEDAISRQAVIYYIKGHIHEIISESGIDKNEHTNRVLRAIMNGVETMPSVNSQRWIPVSERLPEKNVEVLATTEWGAVTIAEMYSANDWFIHEGTTNACTDEIMAWMPLPEPYKAESEE